MDNSLFPRMTARLEQHLSSVRGELPVAFRVAGVRETDRFMSIVTFKLVPESETDGVFDCEKTWNRVRELLDSEFGRELGASIALEIPARFRGPKAVVESIDREREVTGFESTRLRKQDNG